MPTPATETHTSHGLEETEAIAAALVATLGPGAVVALHGQLGAGKTCFVRGLAEALHVDAPVTSPTYALVQEYDGDMPLIHIDLYRVGSGAEALQFGLDEYTEGDGITAIEWAERAGEILPADAVHVRIEPGTSENERTITIRRGDPA